LNQKITFILPGYPAPIGGYRVVYEYANYLAKNRNLITIVHSRKLKNVSSPKNLIGKFKRFLGRIFLQLKRKNFKWINLDKKINLLYVSEPIEKYIPNSDIIVATAWQTADYVNTFSDVKGKKFYLIMDFAPFMGSKNEIETTWKYNFYKITISSWLYNKVLLVNGSRDLINIPIGISHSIFYKKKNIKNDKNIISMMYNKGKYKGSSDGINALIEVKNKLPNAKFILFGKDKRPKHIPKFFIYKRNVSESELVEIYNKTGIFISSSIAEGFGLPAAEAMACGCAIVTTDCGGNREYAINNKTALVSKPSYSKDLSKNIIKLYKNDQLRNKLVDNGKNLIKSFNWENAGFSFEKFINKK